MGEKILVGFLGEGRYDETKYYIEDENNYKNTKYILEALKEFVKPDKIIVITTETAKEKKIENIGIPIIDDVKNHLGEIEILTIPEGKDIENQKEIFRRIVKFFEEYKDASFHVDVTHGFRYLPFIFFTSFVYLKNIYDINIEKIYYGNFERGKEYTPIIDLSYLLDLVNWSSSVYLFNQRFDAEALSKAIVSTKVNTREKSERPTNLPKLGNALSSFSNEFLNVRPIKIANIATDIKEKISKSKEEIKKWADHLLPLFDRLAEEDFRKLSLENPETLDKENLRYQLNLIKIYVDKNLLLQAILLLREFMISYIIYAINEQEKWIDHNFRESVSGALNALYKSASKHNSEETSQNQNVMDVLQKVKKVEDIGGFINHWNRIIEYRNIFAHCDMKKNTPQNLKDFSRDIKEILAYIEKLPHLE